MREIRGLRIVTVVMLVLAAAACRQSSPAGQPDANDIDAAQPIDGSDVPIDTQPATDFDVTGAASIGNTKLQVTFDAAPDPTAATSLSSYAVPGLALTGTPTLSGSTVTIDTASQTAQDFTLTVTGVVRALDQQPLTIATADFTGRTAFDVTSAASTSSVQMTVTFDAAPDPTTAQDLASYSVAGLVLTGTPVLAGNTVTIATAGQTATTFTVVVANVTRASDGEPLTVTSAQFAGTPVLPPTVTDVVVASTLPDNGTTPFNTGTTTVTITGTNFETVGCPAAGVALDDLDGANAAVGTLPLTCTVDSGTQITATLPAGIRTNAANGWNVIVTNDAGSNATSDVHFVPRAGLLVSEVYTGTAGATDHEYVEVYNPTNTTFDPTTLKMHIRNSAGADTNKKLTAVTANLVPARGFLLIASSVSDASDVWFAHEDATYAQALAANGGVYISLSATKDALVLDKVGWGTQPAPGFEGSAAVANIASNFSASRKPGNHTGHATDSDDNLADFDAPSTSLTPLGTADGPEPLATFDVLSAVALSHTSVAVTFDAPPDPTLAIDATNYTIDGGVTVSAASLAGNTVTLTTAGQTATTLTVTVANVTRAIDALPLTTTTATFTGRGSFDVASAASTSAVQMTVTFSDPPDPIAATTLANYTVAGLFLSGTPVLAGNTVTIATSAQTATAFTVVVTGVTRASDAEPLTTTSATFTGTAVAIATVTNVVVASTSPDNGATAFNTGTATVTLTGTDFDTVSCAAATIGVSLDDLDGAGAPVATKATSCTVVSSTQLTATFPSGIRTNAALGWNVIVANTAGSNTTSTVPFVPHAGLLVSEVFPGATGNADHEFVEIYNPTATAIDASGIKLHVRNAAGTTDTNKGLTQVTTPTIPSHGFWLLVSSVSVTGEAWFAHRDATYAAALVGNGGVYISLSAAANQKVIDKVGWGTQPAPGFEGSAAVANILANQSTERKPALGAGDATDADDNVNDFNPPGTAITPLGTVDLPQP